MTSDSIIKTTDYCGNLIYEQGRPHMLLVDGGYVTFNVNDNGNVNDSMQWHYYLKDHLGNNRVVVNTNDSIEQVNHYYPYGGLMAGSIGGDAQRYKYNGKELDRMHGLDWYDYGARWMNGLAFMTPDPKAWDYTDVSPYVYCMDNPVKYIDPDGRKVWVFATELPGGIKGTGATHTFVVVKTSDGNIQRYEYGPDGNSLLDAFSGKSNLTQCFYQDSEKSVSTYMSTGKMDANTKNVEVVNIPNGMTSDQFDDAIIKSASDFKDNQEIKYRIIPIDATEGNCNTSTTSLLKNAGVPQNEINRIGKNINGIKTGFGIMKPWTKKQRETALKEKVKMSESLSNHIGL